MRRHKTQRLFAALVTAVAMGAAIAGPATAGPGATASDKNKKKITGTYLGEAVHPTPPGVELDEPYTSDVIVHVNKGFVVGIYIEARLQCPADSIKDVEYSRYPLAKKDRQKLGTNGGGFKLSGNGINIAGTIGKQSASGDISASDGAGCHVSGVTWTATKTSSSGGLDLR